MAEERFRLPESSYEELVRIIKGYGKSQEESSLDDVAQAAAMNTTTVSRNNTFLVGIGILGGGKKKSITEKGRALSKALQYDNREEISTHWRAIVSANDFMQKLVSAVRIRKGMEQSNLEAHVAYSAGQPKRPKVMTGAGAVVEILKVAGLVKEDEGKLVVTSEASEPRGNIIELAGTISRSHPPPVGPQRKDTTIFSGLLDAKLGLTIQIQVQCSIDEVESLGPKLRSLIKELSTPPTSEKKKPDE